MNILIIGEFSAFAKNLCAGINKIDGNHAVVFSYKDGFKDISQSEDSHTYEPPRKLKFFGITIPASGRITGLFLYRKFKKDIACYKNSFDAVFIINCLFIRKEYERFLPLFSLDDIRSVVKENAKIFLSACGGDSIYYRFVKSDSRMSKAFNENNAFVSKRVAEIEQQVYNVISGVIPMSYQYAQAYRLFADNLTIYPSIHLPFDVNTITERDGYVKNNKIIIFNAALRPTKGITFIKEALDKIQFKYGEKIIIKNDRLPYDQYLKYITTVDLFIDLCVDYDYGMSAITAMGAGCVVFSGNEKETQIELGLDNVPVVGISPDVEDIYKKIEYFILNPHEISRVGKESKEFVSKYHDCKYIASKYLDTFK